MLLDLVTTIQVYVTIVSMDMFWILLLAIALLVIWQDVCIVQLINSVLVVAPILS